MMISVPDSIGNIVAICIFTFSNNVLKSLVFQGH